MNARREARADYELNEHVDQPPAPRRDMEQEAPPSQLISSV